MVAELLRSSNNTLELVDARNFLPLLKARPGLSSWLVLDDVNISHLEQEERASKRKKVNSIEEKDDAAEIQSNNEEENEDGNSEVSNADNENQQMQQGKDSMSLCVIIDSTFSARDYLYIIL